MNQHKKQVFLELRKTNAVTGKEWVYAHRPNVSNVVVILPVIKRKYFLFLIEQRPPLIAEDIAQYSVSIPAGLVGDEDKNESVMQAIKKELYEEAEIITDKIDIVTRKVASSPGCVSETYIIAIAYSDNEYNSDIQTQTDGGVIVQKELVEINNIYNWLKEKEAKGYAISSQALTALFWFKERQDV